MATKIKILTILVLLFPVPAATLSLTDGTIAGQVTGGAAAKLMLGMHCSNQYDYGYCGSGSGWGVSTSAACTALGGRWFLMSTSSRRRTGQGSDSSYICVSP